MKQKHIDILLGDLSLIRGTISTRLYNEFDEEAFSAFAQTEYINVILSEISKRYDTINKAVNIWHLGNTEGVQEDMTEELLQTIDWKRGVKAAANTLPKTFNKVFTDYIQRSDEVREKLHGGIEERLVKFVEDENISIPKEDITKSFAEDQIIAVEAAYSIDNWDTFRTKTIVLANEEKYEELLKHLGL